MAGETGHDDNDDDVELFCSSWRRMSGEKERTGCFLKPWKKRWGFEGKYFTEHSMPQGKNILNQTNLFRRKKATRRASSGIYTGDTAFG